MTISVVIPVYNVKPYLERCVKSVLSQTYRYLEIIIVDDGSTDGSGELCDQIAVKDERIVVIHQENQGLSGARNTGILHSTGEYIMFLDSDDAWLLDDGLEQLMQANHSSLDLIVFKNIDFWNNDRIYHNEDYDIAHIKQLADAQNIFSYLVRTQALRISACFILVRRQILIDKDLFFAKSIISEDLNWSLHLWQHIQTVLLVNLEFYGYYHRNDSITNTTANTLYAYQSYDQIFSYWDEQCKRGCKNSEVIRIFMSDMWVSRGYSFYKLQASEKSAASAIMKRHANLLKYAKTRKSKCAAKLVSLFGVGGAVAVLSLYWRLRMIVIGY